MNRDLPTARFVLLARKSLECTQAEFASYLEVTRTSINKYETGKTIPQGDLILKICGQLAHKSLLKILYDVI